MHIRYRLFLLVFIIAHSALAQQLHFEPLNATFNGLNDVDFLADSIEHTSIKPFETGSIDNTLSSVKKNWVKRKLFSEHLIAINKSDYTIEIDPLYHFQTARNTTSGKYYYNTRGLRVAGTITKKFSFETMAFENEAAFAGYLQQYAIARNVVPGQGTLRPIDGVRRYEYAIPYGFITYRPSKYLTVQFGQDKNFIGNGYRSLLLSDFA